MPADRCVRGTHRDTADFTPEVRLFALIGVLGGFTTFSTFGYESLVLIRSAEYSRAAISIGAHVVAGIFLVWLGYSLATLVVK